jgi:hypothetical protein
MFKYELYCDCQSASSSWCLPLLERMTRCYISLSDNFLFFVYGALSDARKSLYLQCRRKFNFKLYCYRQPVGQFVLVPSPRWVPWSAFNLFVWQLLRLLGVGHPHPYPPWTGRSSPKSKSKVKITFVQGEIINVTIGRAAWEAYSATWNLGPNSAFALGPRKTTENLNWVGRSQDLPDVNWLLASSPALTARAPTLVPICASIFSFVFYFFISFSFPFHNYCYTHMIWIRTKPCVTSVQGTNDYMNKYTCICICDSLIIGKFGSLLKLNPVAWARERTMPTERFPFAGKVSANFCG